MFLGARKRSADPRQAQVPEDPNPQIPSARRAFGFVCLLLVTGEQPFRCALPTLLRAGSIDRLWKRATFSLSRGGGRRGASSSPSCDLGTWVEPVSSAFFSCHDSRITTPVSPHGIIAQHHAWQLAREAFGATLAENSAINGRRISSRTIPTTPAWAPVLFSTLSKY
jgi:hypothetical protein